MNSLSFNRIAHSGALLWPDLVVCHSRLLVMISVLCEVPETRLGWSGVDQMRSHACWKVAAAAVESPMVSWM